MLRGKMVVGFMALGLLLGNSWRASAEELPELPASAPRVGTVCNAGQLVRVGLKTGKKVAVRAAGGMRIAGGLCSEPLAVEAVPWIGALYDDCQPDTGTSELKNHLVKGWCLRDNRGNLTFDLRINSADPEDVLELFYCCGRQAGGSAAYRGSLTLIPTASGEVQPINILPLESYLSGVVPREVPAKFHPQALQAMTCVARSYTLSHLGQHRSQGFDLCDSVHCQVYGGAGGESANVNAIVAQSAGQVLSSGGRPIDATYHAVCGGWGAEPQDIWEGRVRQSYLRALPDAANDGRTEALARLTGQGGDCFVNKRDRRGRDCLVLSDSEKLWRDFIDNPPQAFCQKATRFRWHREFTRRDLLDRLRVSLPQMLGIKPDALGSRLDLRVVRRSAGGRVAEMVIATELGEIRLGGDKVRWLTSGGRIGADGLQSSFFYITKNGDNIVFKGCGWGHGVGLCQEGAQGRALAGHNARQILKHYYPGAVLQRID